MTAVCGISANGHVFVGADSAGVAENELVLRADPKVFVKDQFIFGIAGTFRIGHLLRYSLSVPARKPEVPLHQYMCTTFIDAVRECLKKGGFMLTKEGQEIVDGEVLVGCEGELFVMYSSLQISQELTPYLAVGSGSQVARGALYATDHEPHVSPEVRIKLALQAAERFCSGVRGPFTILSV